MNLLPKNAISKSDFDKTAAQYGEAVASVNTTFAPVYFNLAIFYANLGDKAKAVELLNKVKTLQPDAQLLANTDSVLKQLGQ